MTKSFDDVVQRATTKKTRDLAARRTRELLGEMLLSELRTLVGKSQKEVATILGIKQPSLSKLEGQSDIQISTLRKLVAALGGELEVVVRLPNGDVRISQFADATRSTKALSKPKSPKTKTAQ